MATWGRAAVWIALLAGLGAATAPVVTTRRVGRRDRSTMLLTVAATAGLVATALLVRALVVGDYSLTYVADFSRQGASWPYRAAALWGGMAGSLLWLATLVALIGLGAALRLDRNQLDRARRDGVVAVTGGVVAVLVGLVVAFADPFATLAVPAVDGAGLTPILEHTAMLYHPPLLYLGLATLVGPFALTVVALADHRVDRRLDDVWLATVRRWSLVPWTLLAVGMLAGSHWAYVELGWGGYWAWDPVENTALLPWLAVTVLLHGLRGARADRVDRPPLGRVTLAGLACLPFVLALVGSLLTRSGATSSVHAFAESRDIGRALAVVVAAVVVAVAVLLRRAAGAGLSTPSDQCRSGDGGSDVAVAVTRLVAAHLALVGAVLAVVLAGTLWPLWADLRGGNGIAVEGSYFAQFTGPLLAAALALLCLVPVAVSSRGSRRSVGVVALAGAVGAIGLLFVAAPTVDVPRALLGLAAGACLATALLGAREAWLCRSEGVALGGHLAHAAIGLLALGVAGTATGGSQLVSLRPGESATVLGHEVAYDGLRVDDGPVPGSDAVVADVTTGGQHLEPSLVAYPARGVLLAETSLRSTPLVDVQVTLRTARDDGTALLEVGVHPLQVLVWWGGLAVVAAGAFATWEAGRRRSESASVSPSGHGQPQAAGEMA